MKIQSNKKRVERLYFVVGRDGFRQCAIEGNVNRRRKHIDSIFVGQGPDYPMVRYTKYTSGETPQKTCRATKKES